MNDAFPREVKFTILFDNVSAEEVNALLGDGRGNIRTWPKRKEYGTSWEIRDEASTSMYVGSMIERILNQVRSMRDTLDPLLNHPRSRCQLSVILYIEPDGNVEVGPGFGLSSEQIRFLAELSAEIDFDLYGVRPED